MRSLPRGANRKRTKSDRSGRVRDLLLYVAIALSLVGLTFAYAVYLFKTGGSPELPLKWMGFAGMTAVVFGYAIKACRRLWGTLKFWALLGLFFAVHSGLGVLVLMNVPTVPLVFYALLTAPEYVVLARCLGFFLDPTPD